MRVVAGTARGRRLVAPQGAGTRPTADRVREATFNALGSLGVVEGATVVDLFAGSGALGIEALSRGAVACDFVESSAAACRMIAANLAKTKLSHLGRIHRLPVARFLAMAGKAGATEPAGCGPFDLILMDPPYAVEGLDALLRDLAAGSLVGPQTALLVEHDRQRTLPARVGDLELLKVRSLGDSAFTLYRAT